MRTSMAVLFACAALIAGGCRNPNPDRGEADRKIDSAAHEAGREAYKAAQETKKLATEAGHELRQAGQQAKQGWNEAKRDEGKK